MNGTFLTLDEEIYWDDFKKCQQQKQYVGATHVAEDISITWQGQHKPKGWDVRQRSAELKEAQRRSSTQLRLMKKVLLRKGLAKIEADAAAEAGIANE